MGTHYLNIIAILSHMGAYPGYDLLCLYRSCYIIDPGRLPVLYLVLTWLVSIILYAIFVCKLKTVSIVDPWRFYIPVASMLYNYLYDCAKAAI